MTKIILTFAIVIGLILQWATTSVCRYNFTIDKKTQALNIISDEVNPSLGTTNTYYFHELNCNDANFSFDITARKLKKYPINGKFDFIISSIIKNCGHSKLNENYKCNLYKPLISNNLIN